MSAFARNLSTIFSPNTLNNLQGPIAILSTGAKYSQQGPEGVLQFSTIINLNLAFINVLPIPALDGAVMVLLAIEGLIGRKLPKYVEDGSSLLGVVFLSTLFVWLVVRDSFNIAYKFL